MVNQYLKSKNLIEASPTIENAAYAIQMQISNGKANPVVYGNSNSGCKSSASKSKCGNSKASSRTLDKILSK